MITDTYHKLVTTTVQPPKGHCNGIPTTGWSCCSSSNQCKAGEGDCDSDADCAGGLTCGNNNCRHDFSLLGSNWASSADCCKGIKMIHKWFTIQQKAHTQLLDCIH